MFCSKTGITEALTRDTEREAQSNCRSRARGEESNWAGMVAHAVFPHVEIFKKGLALIHSPGVEL